VTRLVVLAWGNPSRGDDALVPEFLRCVERLVPAVPHEVELVTDFQLQPEHATDLVGRDLALFVDASVVVPVPFGFDAVVPARDPTFTSHAMSPGAVLAACAEAFAQPPPPGFLLAIRGERFVLGDPISAAGRRNLRDAAEFYRQLLSDISMQAWRAATRNKP